MADNDATDEHLPAPQHRASSGITGGAGIVATGTLAVIGVFGIVAAAPGAPGPALALGFTLAAPAACATLVWSALRNTAPPEQPTPAMPPADAQPEQPEDQAQPEPLDLDAAKKALQEHSFTPWQEPPARPTPVERDILPRTATRAAELGYSVDKLFAALDAKPPRRRTGYRGRWLVELPGMDVIVADDSATVLVVYPEGEGLAASQAPTPRAMPRVAGTKKDDRAPMPHSVAELLQLCRKHGFEVDGSSRHFKLTHPDHPGVYCSVSRTPSDYRWAYNCITEIRHKFDIDLREPLE
ncbi:hypothetical protein [Corynebacterium sp. Marseille-Q2516]